MKTSHNPLSLWMRAFIKHQPEASTATAWKYVTEIAPKHEVFPWLIGYDDERRELIYRFTAIHPERRISRASFRRQYNRARQLAGFVS